MKKLRRFSLLLVLLLLIQCLGLPALAQEAEQDTSVSSGCYTLDGQKPLKNDGKLLDTAKAVILYELDSQTLVHSWNPDTPLDPSGMNKIMTALLAVEHGDPEAVVTVSKTALDSVAIGSVSAGLKVGEEITLRDLLYCMMVGSANDAAAVIAEFIGGSQAGFVGMMNERAMELGCQNTVFMNPNGLSHEKQYSTARDLAKITCAALQSELFVELFSAVKYSVPATNKSEAREVVTTNYLMSKETVRNQFDERVTGGKTGALSTTDRSLICTAESGGQRYLSVVMSAQGTVTANGLSVKTFGSFEETRVLLDHGFSTYSRRQLLHEDQVMEQFPVSGGENDVIAHPSSAVEVMLPNDAVTLDVSYRCAVLEEGLSAPIKKGDVIGSVEVWFRGLCVGRSDLVAMFDVNEPGVYNVSLQPAGGTGSGGQWVTWVLIGGIVVLGLLILAGLVLLTVRMVGRVRLRQRHKRRRRDRQRSR